MEKLCGKHVWKMARTKHPRHLVQRGKTYYAALDIPKDLRSRFGGKARFMQSLRTDSESDATILAAPLLANWKRQIHLARRAKSDLGQELLLKAEDWNRDLKKANADEREVLEGVLEEHLGALKIPREQLRDDFINIVMGTAVRLDMHIDAWINALPDQQQKTLDMKRSDARRFAERFRQSDAVTVRAVREWTTRLHREDGLSVNTIKRILSACRSFWKYLSRADLVPEGTDPFADVLPATNNRSKTERQKERVPFEPQEVVKLHERAVHKGDLALADLIWLAMWTGCRIDEVCSLEIASVFEDYILIQDAKSAAGDRRVPIHSALETRLRELVNASPDGYVLPGLSSTNKYASRSGAIGKRFGRLKAETGFPKNKVFHSIRHTVTTMLEQSGVPENISADIVGHEKRTITYGLYSGGTSFAARKEAIEKLAYPMQHKIQPLS